MSTLLKNDLHLLGPDDNNCVSIYIVHCSVCYVFLSAYVSLSSHPFLFLSLCHQGTRPSNLPPPPSCTTHTHTATGNHTHTATRTHTHAPTHAHTHTHARTHAHTHTHTHTRHSLKLIRTALIRKGVCEEGGAGGWGGGVGGRGGHWDLAPSPVTSIQMETILPSLQMQGTCRAPLSRCRSRHVRSVSHTISIHLLPFFTPLWRLRHLRSL